MANFRQASQNVGGFVGQLANAQRAKQAQAQQSQQLVQKLLLEAMIKKQFAEKDPLKEAQAKFFNQFINQQGGGQPGGGQGGVVQPGGQGGFGGFKPSSLNLGGVGFKSPTKPKQDFLIEQPPAKNKKVGGFFGIGAKPEFNEIEFKTISEIKTKQDLQELITDRKKFEDLGIDVQKLIDFFRTKTGTIQTF